MPALSPLMVEVLAAAGRGEIVASPGPAWWRHAEWQGHRCPGLTLAALRRRLLVDVADPDDTGLRRVVPTGEGEQELGEVVRGG